MTTIEDAIEEIRDIVLNEVSIVSDDRLEFGNDFNRRIYSVLEELYDSHPKDAEPEPLEDESRV